jgi:hypothetical protein
MIGKWSMTRNGGRKKAGRTILAAAAGMAIGTWASSAAFAVDPPQPERVWGGCVLSPGTVAAIQADVNDGIGADADTDIQVAFLFVYSLNDNDGQGPVKSGPVTGFTGPVLCANSDADFVDRVVLEPVKIKETDDVPSSGTVDILDIEEAMILRYRLGNGDIEKRVCHTTGNNNDCFRIPQAP